MARLIVGETRGSAGVLHAHVVQGRAYDKTRFMETSDSFYDQQLQQWYGLAEIPLPNPALMSTVEFIVWLEQAPVEDLERFASTNSQD